MDAPFPLFIKDTPVRESTNNPSEFLYGKCDSLPIISLEKSSEKNLELSQNKEYILSMNDILYKLIISYNSKQIHFKIEKKNEFLLYNYTSLYDFKDIVSILKLPLEIYNETNKVIDVIDKAYENKKLILKNDDNFNLLIIIRLTIGFQEIDCPIKTKKTYFNLEEKFNIIIKELNLLKKNKKIILDSEILELENEIKSLKDSVKQEIENNFNFIQSLQMQIMKNSEQLQNNKHEIQQLKNMILNIKGEIGNTETERRGSIKSNNKKVIDKNLDSHKPTTPLPENEKKEIKYEIKKLSEVKNEDFVFNIIVDGAQNVGKTSIIEKFIEEKQPKRNSTSNLSIQNNIKYIQMENIFIKLEINDFNIGDFNKRSTNNYKNSDIIMFVYSIDDNQSFEKILRKLSSLKLKNKQLVVLVGNKSDMESRNVSQKEAEQAVIKYNLGFFMEVSAKTGSNIDSMFYEAVEKIYKGRKNVKSNSYKVVELSKGEEDKKNKSALRFLIPA